MKTMTLITRTAKQFVRTFSIFLSGFDDWGDDSILAAVLAQSQQEYYENLTRQNNNMNNNNSNSNNNNSSNEDFTNKNIPNMDPRNNYPSPNRQ